MKVILFLGMLLFSYKISSAQLKEKTDLEYEDIKGKAAYEYAKHFDVDTLGRKQKKLVYSEITQYNKHGQYVYRKYIHAQPGKQHFDDSTAYTYDIYGNLIKEENYDEYNKLLKRITTEYASPGTMLKETELEYFKDDSGRVEDSSITIDTYTYNKQHLITEIWRSELLDSVNFSQPHLYISNIYEDSGRVRNRYEYRSANKVNIPDTSYMKRNQNWQIVEEYNSQTHSWFTYNKDGKFNTSIYLIKPSLLWSKTIYEYDKWGNKISSRTVDSAGKVIGDVITSRYFNIDKKGNWREVDGYKNGTLVYYCWKDIKYY